MRIRQRPVEQACRLLIAYVDWAVIRLNPRVIWEKPALFCITNAANNSVRFLSEEQRQGVEAFESIFEEIEGFPSREELKLKENEPTDVQAEALILGVVGPEYIVDVLVNERTKINNFREIFEISNRHTEVKFMHGKNYFYPRHDHGVLREAR